MKTKTVAEPPIQIGDKFTIEGCGKSVRGHAVIDGRSVKTRRKMKVKTMTVYAVKQVK